jgi:hypothetical protein
MGFPFGAKRVAVAALTALGICEAGAFSGA